MKIINNIINPMDYILDLLNVKEDDTELLLVDREWVEFVNSYYKYEPKHGDYVYVSFIDNNGWEHAWISIVDRISKDDAIIEVASGCYKQPDDDLDEIGFIDYDSKNETYQFVRKATDSEIEWLNKLMEGDGTTYVDGKLVLL